MSEPARQTLLIIDDEKDVHYSFRRWLQNEPIEVFTAESGDEGIKVAKKHNPDVIVMDIRMGNQSGLDTLKELRALNPKQIIIMMTAYGTSQTAIEAMKRGAYDYVLKPFDIPKLKELLFEALTAARSSDAPALVIKMSPDDARQTIIGNSPAMNQVYKLIGQVAPTTATVLLTGESGTGKELVARAIFQNSARSKETFIPINCAAIPENLLESELFGHEKGAFTGALAQRIGKFEQADGGTLFLDEIGDMPMTTQTKILRVLQEGEISRVGSNTSLKCDVRIIAATNKDLWTAVQKKEFREDLFYRLNVVRVQLPPLRDRLEDLPLLVAYFINKIRLKQPGAPSQISEEAMACLQRYTWPGNVRELENCTQRAMVLATGNTINVVNLPAEISRWTNTQPPSNAASGFTPLQSPLAGVGPAPGSPPIGSAPEGSSPASTNSSAPGGSSPSAESSHTSNPAGSVAGQTGVQSPAGGDRTALQKAMDILFEHARHDKEMALLPAAERELIVRALAETEGNQVKAAKLLGITRATLRKRVDKFGIQKRLAID